MPDKYQDIDEGNRLYQRDLSKALVASLGFDAALEACESNGWEGISFLRHATAQGISNQETANDAGR